MMRLALILILAAAPVMAQEYVRADGPLSDDDFYRLVACAAPPGGDCQKELVRWSKRDARDLSVGIVQVDPGYPPRLARAFAAGLDDTLAAINATGARLTLTLAPEGVAPDIPIFLIDRPRDSAVAGTGLPWFDGQIMQAARFQLNWRGDRTISECAIAMSRDPTVSAVDRLLVEEIVQCLGLMTDIGGRHYESRSIFSETGGVRRLGKQDIAALRRHYP
jgi:hypothetical protein